MGKEVLGIACCSWATEKPVHEAINSDGCVPSLTEDVLAGFQLPPSSKVVCLDVFGEAWVQIVLLETCPGPHLSMVYYKLDHLDVSAKG